MLIVDDEWHVVKSLKADLNMELLEISDIYTAFNIRQAKEVLLNHSIDIMLCDIEMPQGSGLELLEWVKEHNPDTETIFLTSHADFKYAKMAMQLGGSDYLLKPVPDEELENAIQKAKEKINKHNQHSRIQRLWAHHHPVIIERFWMDLLQQTIPLSPVAIRKTIEERDLPITESMRFLPILINVRRWYKLLSLRDEKIMEYALKNSAEETIAEFGGQILTMDNGVFLLVLPFDENKEEEMKSIYLKCENYIQSCNHYFFCDLSCYIGNWVLVHEMVESFAQLKKFEKNNVAFDNKVFFLTGDLSSSPKESFLTQSVVESIKHFIHTHLEQSDLTREEIAKHAFLNPDYLARIFKKETGISIIDYLVQERMKKAKTLLDQTDLSVGTIALAVGYSHFSHFSKMFKKYTGLNPNEFRQQDGK